MALASWLAFFVRRRGWTVVALVFVAAALSAADLRGAARVLLDVGPPAVLASMALFGLETLVDVRAWRLVGRSVGHRLALGKTISVRLGLEALALTAPGGALTADLAGPFLLRRLVGIPLSDAVSIVLLRKWGILGGHAFLLGSSAFLGAPFLEEASRALGIGVDLGDLLALSACVFAFAALVARELLRSGTAERLGQAIARIPSARVRRVVARRAAGLVRADEMTSSFVDAADGRGARLVLLSFGLWSFECLEAFCLLTLLGASPRVTDVMAIEALLSVVRTIAFVLPAGLGVRELGHLSLIASIPGGSPEVATAYVVLRRGLEIFYAVIGVAVSGGRSVRTPPGTNEGSAPVREEAIV